MREGNEQWIDRRQAGVEFASRSESVAQPEILTDGYILHFIGRKQGKFGRSPHTHKVHGYANDIDHDQRNPRRHGSPRMFLKRLAHGAESRLVKTKSRWMVKFAMKINPSASSFAGITCIPNVEVKSLINEYDRRPLHSTSKRYFGK